MSTYPRPVQPLPPRTQRPTQPAPWTARLLILGLSGGLLFVGALLALLIAFQGAYADRILPGVSALGVDLGGLTPAEAESALAAAFGYDQDAVFTFRLPDADTDPSARASWQYSAAELGVRYDPAATVAEAYALGRSGDPIARLVDQGLLWLNGTALTPVVTYDQNVAQSILTALAAQIDQPGSNGALSLDGTQITAQYGQVGRQLDITATLTRLNNAISGLTTGAEIALVVTETAPSITGVTLAESRLQAALSAPMTLTADDGQGGTLGPWTVSTEQIASLLELSLLPQPDGTQQYEVSVTMEPFRASLDALAPGLVTPPRDGRFRFDEVTQALQVIQPAQGGRALDVDATLAAMEAQVFSRTERSVPLAFRYTQPRYHNQITAAELGIRELVAESTTYFTGSSANRRTNIAVSASRFDGVIIGPGEEFSFNTLLGEISEENGFVEGKVIFGGRTITGLGGGVCQVSTTAFRAAFTGGFTIIERNSHGYRVGYYELNGQPPGLDAAIWQPERDFRFQNDTPHHLLIETSVFPTTNTLQFRFYSTDTGRRVEVEQARVANVVPAKPTQYVVNADLQPGQIVQVDYSADGADVNVTRRVTYPDGSVREDNIFTHYLPWGAIFEVAPGDSRLGG